MFSKAIASLKDWSGVLALFLVLTGGVAYAADTIGSSDVIDNSLLSADLANNQAVKSADVANGQLNDEDVGQGTFVNFAANVGTVFTGTCSRADISGINAQGDHLLLTPSTADDNPYLEYTIEYDPAQEAAKLRTCNYTNVNQNDGTTHFNLLVFDAQ
jgi:hypothetical protein